MALSRVTSQTRPFVAVIAEGVETALQAELLTALQCDFGQGFFFSPALDSVQATALLAEEHHPAWASKVGAAASA